MASLPTLASGCDEAAATLAAVAYAVRAGGPGHEVFGADGPGRLAELGVALHDLWLTATEDRAAEATATATRLADVANGLRAASVAYADTDESARRRLVTGEQR